MNIPLKWLKEYVDIPEKTRDFTDKMSMIEHMLDKIIETETDTVVDLELRGNRADCYGILGIAREAHAAFGGRYDIPQVIDLPEHDYQGFEVLVRSDMVKRFYSTVIRGVKIGPSPEWMQERLRNYGMESINNVVDITNYVMIESGMPMHAFDLKNMRGNQLILRPAKESEKVVTFDGGELKLVPADTVFATESGEAIGLAGIVGDRSSGVNDTTTDILLECANYDRSAIRKTVMSHNAWTEAGTRHSHEISSSLCDYALARAASLLLEYGNTEPNITPRIEGVHDYYPHPEVSIRIEFRPAEVKRLGGVVIDIATQKSILERLEYKIEVLAEDKLAVTPPLSRTDVTLEADVVEDVMRVFGYENIPSTTLSSTIPDPIVLPELVIEEKSRDIFTALGLDEVILVPMSNPESLARTNDPLASRVIEILNPSVSHYSHLRTNLLTGLLEAVKKVTDRGDERVAYFEAGKIYLKKNKPLHQPPHDPDFPYMELRRMVAVISSKHNEYDFYQVKGILEEYFDSLHVRDIVYEKAEHPMYELAAVIKKDDVEIGYVGKVTSQVSMSNFDIKYPVFAFELYTDALASLEQEETSYMPYSTYPEVKMDMSILIPRSLAADVLVKEIYATGGEIVRSVEITDVYEMERERSLLFSVVYQSKERTLATEDVNEVHLKIGDGLIRKYGAKVRGREEIEARQVNSISRVAEERYLTALPEEKDPAVIKNKLVVQEKPRIVVGRILEVNQHPNADRLVLCKVDVGSAKPDATIYPDALQIVTGADNIKPGIAEGKLVPVALPGAVVKNHKDDSTMTIKKGNLRGEKSEGMLCSKKELEVEDPEGGIWILGDEYAGRTGEVFRAF